VERRQFQQQGFLGEESDDDGEPDAVDPERAEGHEPRRLLSEHRPIEWPLGPGGKRYPIMGLVLQAVVLKGENVDTAKDFVHFLVEGGWLAQYLNFAGDLFLPTMPALLRQPFWLDASDPHRMAAVMQAEAWPMVHSYAVASGNWRYDRIFQERVWAKAIHRIVTEGVTPEQAVDEALARIKQILSE
jgi:multiple sugar transport system substrate-binding protein